MGEIWEKEYCCHCKAKNWIYLYPSSGDDGTGPCYESATCWSCGKEFDLVEEYIFPAEGPDSVAEGKEKPQ